jgi:uncharacterized membrane protein YsdA (DUF1294 family)/cold shock CspA family protein
MMGNLAERIARIETEERDRMDHGIVVKFDAKKGFGFIRSSAYPDDVFVHASAVDGGRLSVGQRVQFLAEPNERGPRASRVEPGRRGLSPARAAALALGVVLIGAMIGLHTIGLGWIGAWLIGINFATWPVYAWDKHRARLQGRRVPEAVLLALALIGGSPAAIAAMIGLHHKTRKPAFLIPFAVVLIVQIGLIVWMLWDRKMGAMLTSL